jgi:hypothetical protein
VSVTRRRERIGQKWLDDVAEMVRRGMVPRDGLRAYQDADETLSGQFLAECDAADPVGFGWERGKEPKGPGISRGKSRSTAANPTGER